MASTTSVGHAQGEAVSELALAAVLAITILIASTISVEIGLSVALIELAAGVAVGNLFTVSVPDWLSFVGSFAGVVLTFLAGAEVDVPQFRREWRASLSIGAVSFVAPFVVAMSFAYWLVGWNRDQAEIGGLALSTTSLAVVYAVLVETGLNRSIIGKRIMSATFVTDILTVIGLSLLFITPNVWIIPFVAVSVLMIWGFPRISPWFFARYGDRVIEPEIKLVFAALFVLMYLGDKADSQAVLPAFILGLAMSGHYAEHRTEQERLRVVAFAFLTPFFFLKGGLNVSLSAVWANLGILALLVVAKMLPKFGGVYPLARRYCSPNAAFTTLLMSTGLTFGTITSLYGLQSGIIDQTQFSLLITVVVLSAIVPTAIAQHFFEPRAHVERSPELAPDSPAGRRRPLPGRPQEGET
ncbi:MAG TPA: cation:proton antiporter [Gaiellales bacterium]|jgi:Kef-type K+ transport system membrane component KefB|nr:cation:proton antiporter [Gaiellales bacterium]